MYLPSPPDYRERILFLDSGRFRLYLVSSVSTFILIIGMILFVKSNPYFIPYSIFALFISFYLTLTYFVGFLGRDFDYDWHRFLLGKWLDRAESQSVDIFLPVCGEPIEVLANTWRAVRDLNLAHLGQLNIYVLDDGSLPWVGRLAEEFGFEYVNRGSNELKKAGNLRHAFARTTGEFFIIFDADFCPAKSFLIETLPYMYENNNCAIVQTPQFFSYCKLQTAIEQGAGVIQELFYRLIQVNRDTFGGAICVGTNALYRRAPLVPMGGTAPIGYSEDVRTGFRLLAAGSDLKYIPLNLAKGICPDNWRQFWSQQYRWGMGSLDLMLSKEFWIAEISRMQRICYMTGMLYYTTTGLAMAFSFVPSIYILIAAPERCHYFNLIWSIPSLLLTNIYMRYWQKTAFKWSAIECRQVSYYAHLWALKDLIFKTAEEWQPTGGVKKSSKFLTFKRSIRVHTFLILIIVWGLVAWRISGGHKIYNFIPLLMLTIYHYMTLRRVLK